MKKNAIISPITHKPNVTVLEKIESQFIIDKYKKDYQLDTERSFSDFPEVYICQCKDSGFRFYSPAEVAGDEQFYADFQRNLNTYYKNWRWEYTQALNIILPTDKVLEIGTGAGAFFEKLTQKTPHATGLELSNLAIEKAKAKNLNVVNELIENHAIKYKNYYDIIVFFQVLEHITDVKTFLESSLACLKKGGKIILSVPNNNPYIYRYEKYYTSNLPPHHAGLWDKQALQNLENFFAMKTVAVKTEPLFDIPYQIAAWATHKNMPTFAKNVQKMPKIARKALYLLAPVFEGVNLMAIYEKI